MCMSYNSLQSLYAFPYGKLNTQAPDSCTTVTTVQHASAQHGNVTPSSRIHRHASCFLMTSHWNMLNVRSNNNYCNHVNYQYNLNFTHLSDIFQSSCWDGWHDVNEDTGKTAAGNVGVKKTSRSSSRMPLVWCKNSSTKNLLVQLVEHLELVLRFKLVRSLETE